jgi:hypothetical protein
MNNKPALKSSPKPIILLPLRLEIRYITHSASGDKTERACYSYEDRNDGTGKKPGFRKDKSEKKELKPAGTQEIWIRWYPDDCQIFPPISKISADEIAAYKKYDSTEKTADTWAKLVSEVGLQRARYIVDNEGNDPDFVVKDFAEQDDLPEESLQQFMAVGAKLKALPRRVRLYTIREDEKTLKRKIELLAEGNDIPEDIVISSNDIPSSRWTVDFEEAVKNGMGIKITGPNNKYEQVKNADWLVAVGHKNDGGQILQELLLRHKALGEFNILRQGTPTNNTEDCKTEYMADESGTPKEKEIFDPAAGLSEDGLSNKELLMSYLDLNDERIFSGIKNSSRVDQQASRAMRRLLFKPCTYDYRRRFLNFSKNNDKAFPDLVEHFRSYVIGGGLFPAIQIGDNPYGILPVTILQKWKSIASEKEKNTIETTIAEKCRSLKNIYMRFAQTVPHIDLADNEQDVFNTLKHILQLNPVSHRVDIQVFKKLINFNEDLRELHCPLIAKGKTEKKKRDNMIDYLDLLINDLESPTNGSESASSRNTLPEEDNEASLFERLLKFHIYLLVQMKTSPSHLAEPITVLCNLLKAEELSVTSLETMFLEVLDCLSYRLDAWISSLAYLRLREINENGVKLSEEPPPEFKNRLQNVVKKLRLKNRLHYDRASRTLAFNGTMTRYQRKKLVEYFPAYKLVVERLYEVSQEASPGIGVYGWLEKPSAEGLMEESKGYLQAPSMDQAITGAILRSAALSDKNDKDSPFQINLSSERVKMAIWFVQGLQSGYTSAELLGYQVERKLHDKGLDKYLLDLRKTYPLSNQEGTEIFKNSRVIDGEKFLTGGKDKKAIKRKDRKAIEEIRSEVRHIRDAVADLSVAETLYQTVRGNSARTAAWLEAVEGKAIPPEPEVMKTPRTGHPQTQRVLYPLSINLDNIDFSELSNPRIIAEPFIAEFCEEQLNDFDNLVFKATISLREGGNGSSSYSVIVSLKDDLEMAPIDLIVGGTAELEKKTRMWTWCKLIQDRLAVEDFENQDLMQKLIGQRIILKDEKHYFYFNDYIKNKDQLKEELDQTNISDEETEKVVAIWRKIQNWKFLGHEFLSKPTITELDSRTTINFDNTYYENEATKLESHIKKAEHLHLFLKSVQPLSVGDIVETADMGLEKIIQQKTDICNHLNKRFIALRKTLGKDFKVLEDIRNSLNNNTSNKQNNIALQNQLLNICRYGLPDVLTFIPIITSEKDKKEVIEVADLLLKKMEAVKAELDKGIKPELVINAVKAKIKIDDDGKIKKLMDDNKWEEIEDGNVKVLAIDKLIKETIVMLKKRTAGDAMFVFQPFSLEEKLSISGTEANHKDMTIVMTEDYSKVRKNIESLMKKILPERMKVISNIGIQKSKEEAITQAELPEGVSVDDVCPEDVIKPVDWSQSSVDLHYVIPQEGLTVPGQKLRVGFKVDEWTDFIPNTKETTGLAFQYKTPQAEAPQAILLAVPPSPEPGVWHDGELVDIIADTIDLMRIRSVSSEKVAGSVLGNLLPCLFFEYADKHKCRFPSVSRKLYDGAIKGGWFFQLKKGR